MNFEASTELEERLRFYLGCDHAQRHRSHALLQQHVALAAFPVVVVDVCVLLRHGVERHDLGKIYRTSIALLFTHVSTLLRGLAI